MAWCLSTPEQIKFKFYVQSISHGHEYIALCGDNHQWSCTHCSQGNSKLWPNSRASWKLKSSQVAFNHWIGKEQSEPQALKPKVSDTLSIIACLIKRHVNRNYGKICSPTSNSKSTTYRKINSPTWSNQTGGGLVNFTYAYTKGSRQKTDILRSGWPDRKQMWKLWPIFSLKFDSLILKTHFISLWRV